MALSASSSAAITSSSRLNGKESGPLLGRLGASLKVNRLAGRNTFGPWPPRFCVNTCRLSAWKVPDPPTPPLADNGMEISMQLFSLRSPGHNHFSCHLKIGYHEYYRKPEILENLDNFRNENGHEDN